MRIAFCALVALFATGSTALAQTGQHQRAPNAVLQLQQPHILDGVWRVGGLGGELTLTTRDNEVLEGQWEGGACHGQHRGNAFTLLCPVAARGPLLLSGIAVETPPVATARARIVARPAELRGQVFQAHLDRRGYVEELGELRATRQ